MSWDRRFSDPVIGPTGTTGCHRPVDGAGAPNSVNDAILAGEAAFAAVCVIVTSIETTPARKSCAAAGIMKRAHSEAAPTAKCAGRK
jgi:hypothetical protein